MNIQTGTTALTPLVREQSQAQPPRQQHGIGTPLPEDPRNPFETIADAVVNTSYFAFSEIVEAGKNDPALALRYGATTLSEQILTGVSDNVRQGFAAAIIPTIRLSLLAANGYRAHKTFKDPTTHWAERAFDVARVGTDVIGLAGAVLKYAWPTTSAVGDTLVGISYAADAVSHSVRLMTHGAERVTVWKKQISERKAAKVKRPQIQPPAPPAARG